jgi:hypothetical protein
MSTNPFYLKALPDVADELFCNRVKEIATLVRMAESKNDVVIYAPRRYGKTTLVRRVQRKLAAEGAITICTDFNGVGSVNDVATRLAAAVYEVTHGNEALWKKALRVLTSFRPVLRPSMDSMNVEITAEVAAGRTGIELLDAIMKELQQFVNESDSLVNVVFDEFQEIVALPDAPKIEAIMRTHIQQYQASHFFVGSRRRLLQNMFDDEQRPFFRSALNFHLKELPCEELVPFLVGLFAKGGKKLPNEVAKGLVRLVKCHPHYTIKLSYHVFERAGDEVSIDDVYAGLANLLSDDKLLFESMVQALPAQQRLLLRALAKEPTDKLLAKEYVRKHDLGTSSGISHSNKQLLNLDYIEVGEDRVWRVVDPVFSIWLAAGETVPVRMVTEKWAEGKHSISEKKIRK